MKQRNFLHIDMDAYFAAVEQRDNPALKGKAVIIGPNPHAGELRGVISTCSYEARRFGLHSAMPVKEAFRRCPQGVFLHGDHKKYKRVSMQIFEIFSRFTPIYEPLSLDEAFLDITGSIDLFGDPAEIAFLIKETVKRELNLTCSVGVASKKYLAKIGSDFNKPDGITEILPEKELEFIAALPIQKIWGVGKKSLIALQALGVYTGADLQQRSREELAHHFGKFGEHLYRLANAIDERGISRGRIRKSISKERTYHTDIGDVAQIKQTLLHLCEELASEARRKDFLGQTIQLKYRYSDFSTFTRQVPYQLGFIHYEEMYQLILRLFESNFNKAKKIRLVGVGLSNPVGQELQTNLFDESKAKAKELAKAQDALNKRFGKRTIRSAEGLK
jgi:nucleotidyltransferase/DNA polymerase involved in DNA repair